MPVINASPPRRHDLDGLLSVLREPALPRMSQHDALDTALLLAIDGDDACAALSVLFSGASFKAALPRKRSHGNVNSLGDLYKNTDMVSRQTLQVFEQFEGMIQAAQQVDFDCVTWTSARGLKMIHFCAIANDADGLRTLLRAGANSLDRTNVGRDPLSYAAQHAGTAVLQILLQRPEVLAGLTAPDGVGQTPLIWAASSASTLACEVLLKAGADPNTADALGFTPLHHACGNDAWECCRMLITHGASVQKKSEHGGSAADWARQAGFDKLADEMIAWDRAAQAMQAIDLALNRANPKVTAK